MILPGKLCSRCKSEKSLESFGKDKNKKDGLDPWCLECKRVSNRASYQKHKARHKATAKLWREANRDEYLKRKRHKRDIDPSNELVYSAKHRAKTKGLEFDLTKDDIVIPDMCPVLGTAISKRNTKQSRSSPSIDRIDPTRGYTKDNIQIISWQANTMKNNATKEELIAFAEWVLKFYKE